MSVLSLTFWLSSLYFILAIFLAFYIPGVFFISKLKLGKFQETVLSFVVGMVLWGWQGMIFGYANIRFASYFYILFFLLFWLKRLKLSKFKFALPSWEKYDYILVVVFIAGILSQLSSIWFSGILVKQGLSFCCGMPPDNILNVAITNQIATHFPPFEPGYYGKFVANYHYWDSLVMGELIRVFKLPLIATNFQFMTVFISLFLGLSALVMSQILGLRKAFKRWLVLLLYLGGDLVWFIVIFTRGMQIFNMHPMESGQQFLENLPRAFSVVVLFASLSLFVVWIRKKDALLTVILSLVFSSLIGFKIYTGLLIFPGLAILVLYGLLKKDNKYLLLFLLTSLFSAIIYLPVNAGAGGLYYSGPWRFEDFIMQGYFGKLNNLELARRVYLAHNSWLRVLEYELIYAALFIFATFGTKLLGLIQTRKSMARFPKELHLLIIPGFIVSFILGSFFLQRSGGSNTFNFLVSIFIVGSIYTALALDNLIKDKNKFFAAFVIIVVLLFTLPRGIDQVYENLTNIKNGAGFIITTQELKGLDALKNIQTDKLVLVDPAFSEDVLSPYVSFMSNQRMFLSGEWDELDAHNINYSDRSQALSIILNSPYPSSVSAELARYNVGYIYMKSQDRLFATDSSKFLKPVFNN
ncbi:MAG: hypothetical protein M1409_10965, partial [Actinobacteria bacterium]|nr:hypothetical protein [Actinomycetota bacterium]